MSKMKQDIEATSVSSIETSNTANKLAHIADESSKIVSESKKTIDKITEYSDLIEQQKNQSINILHSVESLLNDTVEINKLCQEEQRDDEKIKTTLVDFKNSFETITGIFKEQEEKKMSSMAQLIILKMLCLRIYTMLIF